MCGICGIFDPRQQISPQNKRKWVEEMNAHLHHRGPDETSFWNDQINFLGFKRLSIIDLQTGSQPIFNEDRSVCLIFNGEIYNYLELREELLEKGHQFTTQTDTEVLVHLYEEEGMEMLSRLNGMFAFCLFDMRQQICYLARDPFGEKPLYFWLNDHRLAFSSELKSLLQCKLIERRLNLESLNYTLAMGMSPEPMTLFQEVQNLPPGHYLQFSTAGSEIRPYFEVNYQENPDLKTEADVLTFLRPYLEQAVKRQSRTDVPLGAFLSGGIDSSSIVALLQQQSTSPLKTFTVQFDETRYDESPIARKVAQRLGTHHHELRIPNMDFNEDIFWHILDHTGLPFTDTSAIPTYYISKEIRKHVKVALSGDGGDEVFGGYPIFHWWVRIHQLKTLPAFLRKGGYSMLDLCSGLPMLKRLTILRQLKKALQLSQYPSPRIPMEIMRAFPPSFIPPSVGRSNTAEFPLFTDFWNQAKHWSSLRQIMYFRLKNNLPLNLLPKVDRMSMSASLEVRSPFLDRDLFGAVAQVPDHFLLRGSKGKYILRQLMKPDLPAEVFSHPKQGFAIPLHRYMNANYHQLVRERIRKDHPLDSLLDWNQVQQIVQTGLLTQRDNAQLSTYQASMRLWVLLALYAWVDRFEVQL